MDHDTRESLLLRLPDRDDAQAWQEFVTIYEPFVYRLGRRCGLQQADAQELVQNVLLAVSNSIERWKVDPTQCRFRTWLFRVARNHMLHLVSKRRMDRAVGGTSHLLRMESTLAPLPDQEDTSEYRRELFYLAAGVVRGCFRDTTWRAFWETSVKGRPIDEVSIELEMSAEAIYIARCRVKYRLIETIRGWEALHDM